MTTQLTSTDPTPAHEDRCADCDGALRAGEDVRCRWCDDNRARHPEDYEIAPPTWDDVPEAVAS